MADEKSGFADYFGAAMPILSTGLDAITRGGPRRQYKWAKKYANFENKMNRANAEWTLAQNRELQAQQRLYDSPIEQRKRMEAAGYNPNLFYGMGNSGASQAVAMDAISPVRLGQPQSSYGELGSALMQSHMQQAQMGMIEQKQVESQQKTELLQAQEQLIQANPYMRPAYVDAMVKQLQAVADLKAREESWSSTRQTEQSTDESGNPVFTVRASNGYRKMNEELKLLEQRFHLSEADQKIKAKILESKEFQNAILEIEKKWKADGDLSPQVIMDGIFKLISVLR